MLSTEPLAVARLEGSARARPLADNINPIPLPSSLHKPIFLFGRQGDISIWR
jgi:hypothetical protein